MNHICMDLIKLNNISNPYTRIFNTKLDPFKYECPPEVTNCMHKLKNSVHYHSNIGINVNLFFYTLEKDDCIHRFHIVMTMLRYMVKFVTPRDIRVDFVLTDSKKQLPKRGLIGPSTLNTGYTDGKHIVVYREEEWLKVFIHECMHYFMFDGELRSKPMILYHLFPIHKNVDVNECYCEIWARILNCCVISVMNKVSLEMLLEREKKFSVQQMVKILNYMNLTYTDLLNENTIYHEDTNAFAYLVITAILIHNPTLFVSWCKKHNKFSMLTIENSDEYVKLIEHQYKLQSFLDTTKHTNTSLSTKMSINNICL